MIINGENVSPQEQRKILKMLRHDAEEVAGEFYDMERSEKFRLNWPDQDQFVKSEWKNFVAAVRLMYTARLGDPNTPPKDADKMFKAIVMQNMMSQGRETDTRLQIMPNTQTFMGDRAENRRTIEKFGKTPNYRARKRQLLNAIADDFK